MIFAIAVGGAAGSLARYGTALLLFRASTGFPYGTLLVNVTGSFLLGFLLRYLPATSASPELRGALTVGFCGGYTTFSTFSVDVVRLLEEGSFGRAAAYAATSVVLSVGATLAGFTLAREIA